MLTYIFEIKHFYFAFFFLLAFNALAASPFKVDVSHKNQ